MPDWDAVIVGSGFGGLSSRTDLQVPASVCVYWSAARRIPRMLFLDPHWIYETTSGIE
jgi:NADH dehydrogenase FAD-containing subunit